MDANFCVTGSFTSAKNAPGSSSGRPSDKDELYGDPAGRDDSFTSAKSFGGASAVSARSFQSAKSGNRVCQMPFFAKLSCVPDLNFCT